jgi:hypothetical protein
VPTAKQIKGIRSRVREFRPYYLTVITDGTLLGPFGAIAQVLLTFRYPNMGADYDRRTMYGTEANVRDLLRNGGISAAAIDELFTNAH